MMTADHRSPTTTHTRSVDRNLEEAESSGYLDFSNRKLCELPEAVSEYDLSDTVDTNISKNRFTEIPNKICEFHLLEKLNCYNNCLRCLPEAIIKLQYLTYIDLCRNQLSHLPSYICELQSLEVLLVANNKLVSIPEEIGKLQMLMELDVSCNEIASLPVQIGDMVNLRILNLRKNLLVELPNEISKLKLKSLNFSCNKIQNIPLEFRSMDCLDELLLDNNPLVIPPAHVCTKGRVHILKYLLIQAIKEDKKRGVLAETNSNRNTINRSISRDEADSVRLRRKAIMSTDSGYNTDIPMKWTNQVNGIESNLSLRSGDGTRESRAEQRRTHTGNVNLSLPVNSDIDITDFDVCISPLKTHPEQTTAADGDIFSKTLKNLCKELFRQKQEYEQKKKKAEQLRSESATRRSGGRSLQTTPSSSHSSPSPITPLPANSTKTPQTPARSTSVILPRSMSHGYTDMNSTNYHFSASHLPYYNSTNARSGTTSVPENLAADLLKTDRSSPYSTSSQDDDGLSFTAPPQEAYSLDPAGKIVNTRSRPDNPKTREASTDLGQKTPPTVINPSESHSGSLKVSKSQIPSGYHTSLLIGSSPPTEPSPNETHTNGCTPEDQKAVAQLKEIIETRLRITLPYDVMSELRDGVILCHLANHIKPRSVSQIHVKSSAVPKLSVVKCKKNVENFLDACRKLGVSQDDMCCNGDILDDKRPVLLLRTIEALINAKASVKPAIVTNPSMPSSGRIGLPSSRVPSANLNRTSTANSKRPPQPLHSFV